MSGWGEQFWQSRVRDSFSSSADGASFKFYARLPWEPEEEEPPPTRASAGDRFGARKNLPVTFTGGKSRPARSKHEVLLQLASMLDILEEKGREDCVSIDWGGDLRITFSSDRANIHMDGSNAVVNI